jgi:sugar lactone lactonase YvrE
VSGSVERLKPDLVLDAGAQLAEGPFWDTERAKLIWVDIEGSAVHWFDPSTGTDHAVDVGQHVGAAVLRQGGGLVLAVRDGFALWTESGLDVIASFNEPDLRMNDGKVDPAGRFWAGSMAYDERPGPGWLYRLDPDRSVHRVIGGLGISNGMDWSDDATAMYFIDSLAGGVDVLDFDVQQGNVSNRRRVIEIPESLGVPDGMTLDAEGCLWVAIWGAGEVRRFTPDGALLGVVELPEEGTTCCAFGGTELRDLYITSGASLYRCVPGVRGRPVNRFGG